MAGPKRVFTRMVTNPKVPPLPGRAKRGRPYTELSLPPRKTEKFHGVLPCFGARLSALVDSARRHRRRGCNIAERGTTNTITCALGASTQNFQASPTTGSDQWARSTRDLQPTRALPHNPRIIMTVHTFINFIFTLIFYYTII